MTIERLKTKENARQAPKRIVRPCEWGLRSAISGMESQLGTIEAYNMLVDYANKMKAQIDAGNAKAQLEYFATDPRSAK